MLQQTRVAAVIPYYERFLERFPTVERLACAADEMLLRAWSGLGYYSRVRNMRSAARQIVELGGFPKDRDGLRALAGVGEYTAAAVASIAFGLPYAAVDGNVLRVMARLTNDSGDIQAAVTRKRLAKEAQTLLDRKRPGEFNQAVMELGATLCSPKQPQCRRCPLASDCEALRAGTQNELPVRLRTSEIHRIDKTVLIAERRGKVLLRLRPPDSSKLAGFWELPEACELETARIGDELGSFQHSITNHNYRISVVRATLKEAPATFQWIALERLREIPLSTIAKKSFRFLTNRG
jgi:A/G-specific adenine glycosylase